MLKPSVPYALGASLFSLAVGIVPIALAQSNTTKVNANGLTCFNGYGYTLDGGDYRYTEHHEVRRIDGQITTWNVIYIGRQGRVLAKKHMDFSENPTVPVYRMIMPTSGYQEGIRHQNGRWRMTRRESTDAKIKTKGFEIDKPMAADAGFNILVQDYFDTLQAGQTLPFKFVAAGRQSVIDLKANKTGTTTFEGRPAVNFTAKLDMFLVGWFVSSLKLTYDPATRRLLEYRGIGNIRGRDGKVYPVRVSYYSQMPQAASAHDAPTARCGSADADWNT